MNSDERGEMRDELGHQHRDRLISHHLSLITHPLISLIRWFFRCGCAGVVITGNAQGVIVE